MCTLRILLNVPLQRHVHVENIIKCPAAAVMCTLRILIKCPAAAVTCTLRILIKCPAAAVMCTLRI